MISGLRTRYFYRITGVTAGARERGVYFICEGGIMSKKNYSDLIAKLLKDSDGLDRHAKEFLLRNYKKI